MSHLFHRHPPFPKGYLRNFACRKSTTPTSFWPKKSSAMSTEDGYLRRELHLVVQDLILSFGLEIPDAKGRRFFAAYSILIRPELPRGPCRSVSLLRSNPAFTTILSATCPQDSRASF